MSALKRNYKCFVLGCTNGHQSLYRLPQSESLRTSWLDFIFYGNVPKKIPRMLHVCANHFTPDCFKNESQFNAGLSTSLILNNESIPTLRSQTIKSEQDVSEVSVSGITDQTSTDLLVSVCNGEDQKTSVNLLDCGMELKQEIKEEEQTDKGDLIHSVVEAEDGEGTPVKTQGPRSFARVLHTSERAPHLFPVQCIICKHEKYIVQTHSRKRLKEKLTLCETLHAGKLLLAAEGRMDESLLLHIKDRDLMASEARYHFTCYRDYTRFLTTQKIERTEMNIYANGYKHFCKTVIEERLVKQREVLQLSKLNLLFKKTVEETEGVNIAAYKAHSLKARLHKSHPFLKFLKASTTYLVYVDNLSADEIVHEVASSSSEEVKEK